MSELAEHWSVPQRGTWQHCPRYDLMVTGCSRHFVCKSGGIITCYDIFPKRGGINLATTSTTIKKGMVSVKEHPFSVKLAGV